MVYVCTRLKKMKMKEKRETGPQCSDEVFHSSPTSQGALVEMNGRTWYVSCLDYSKLLYVIYVGKHEFPPHAHLLNFKYTFRH